MVWQKCSGDPQKARENNIVELLGLVDSYQDSYLPTFISRLIPEGNILSFISEDSISAKTVKPSLSDKHRILIVSAFCREGLFQKASLRSHFLGQRHCERPEISSVSDFRLFRLGL